MGQIQQSEPVKALFSAMFLSLFSLMGLAADKLAVGTAMPSVTCNDQDGQSVNLAKDGAQGYVLVYFYPKASTPGCTKQGCSLRDSWGDLQKAGVRVYGVSTDDEASQKKFRNNQKFPFPLLADHEKKIVEAFGVKNVIGMASRSAFLFKDGKCVWVDPKGSTSDQAEQVLAFLKTQKS
jgi:peroxiredoxin Q/BCP